jgi:hypothetical protein
MSCRGRYTVISFKDKFAYEVSRPDTTPPNKPDHPISTSANEYKKAYGESALQFHQNRSIWNNVRGCTKNRKNPATLKPSMQLSSHV